MFRDGSWWLCSFFIGLFSYMLGATDSEVTLDDIASFAGVIAGCATAFAAFFAYKSFQSWEERVKNLHKLEQSSESLKALSHAHESVMQELHKYCRETVNIKCLRGFSSINEVRLNEYPSQLQQFKKVKECFNTSLDNYNAACSNYKAITNKESLSVFYTSQEIINFHKNITKDSEGVGKREIKQEDIEKINLFHTKGARKIADLFKALYEVE